MKLILLSDTHCQTDKVEIPYGDVLIHCGDFSFRGDSGEIWDFAEWLKEQPHKYKLWIPGNHELGLEDFPYNTKIIDHYAGSICLHNKEHSIDGIKFFGSAWTPEFNNWAFNHNKEQAKRYWAYAPDEIDVLITHGPPLGFLDNSDINNRLGCKSLLNYTKRVQPKVHAFGHIHGGYGHITHRWENTGAYTQFLNVSQLDERYKRVNKPVVVEI
jgi:Icc-related predicted phosphoesterase